MPFPVARFTAILSAALLAALHAFSAPPTGGTTAPQGLAPDTVVTPLRGVQPPPRAQEANPGSEPAPPADARPAARTPIPLGPAPHLALILPVASPSLGSVAEAVRLGVLAAAEVEGSGALPVRLYATQDDGPAVLAACQQAQREGALVVVAGLTRDGAAALARSDCPRQPTLVLNEPAVADLPERMYAISLAIEQEARQAALLAIADGWRSAIVIAAASPLARRAQEAFEREWSRAAGEIRRLPFGGNPDDAPAMRERLAAVPGDMVFLALDQPATRAIRPYISGGLPVYATSLGVDPRAAASVNVDLEGVRYLDMPWFVQPDHPAVMVYPAAPFAMSVELERLYALGIDAYRLGKTLAAAAGRNPALDGVTGRIALDPARRFTRTLVPAVLDAGHAVPLGTPASP